MNYEITSETRALLSIYQWRGLGVAKIRELIAQNKSSSINLIELAARIYPQLAPSNSQTSSYAESAAEQITENCFRNGIKIISALDKEYPKKLNLIDDYPPFIYVKGEMSALAIPGVAVVGTRQASEHGRKAASVIASYLAEKAYSIVSGLALGIDTAAHEAALNSKGITIAIMAHGLDAVYPASNRKLAARIVEQGGALISEHPPKVPPRPAEFVRRNRIQSGISICSIIVESGAQGGAIHQANFTKSQGRLLLAVRPREPELNNDFNYEGTNYLVNELKATPISGTKDLARELIKNTDDSSNINGLALKLSENISTDL